MAYAALAGLDPVHGLYISFFSSLTYALFGRSGQLSMGCLGVVGLMTGAVVLRESPESFDDRLRKCKLDEIRAANLSQGTDTMQMNWQNSTIEPDLVEAIVMSPTRVEVACALCFAVGIAQVNFLNFFAKFVPIFFLKQPLILFINFSSTMTS